LGELDAQGKTSSLFSVPSLEGGEEVAHRVVESCLKKKGKTYPHAAVCRDSQENGWARMMTKPKHGYWGLLLLLLLPLMVGVIWQMIPLTISHANTEELHIVLDHDQLTMHLHDASLVDVVERIAQTLYLASHVAPDLEHTLVTLDIKSVPIRQGLDRLLANTNYVLTDRDLYVWSRNAPFKDGEWRERQQEASLSEPEEDPELTEGELRYQAIYGKDPEVRAVALEVLSSEADEGVTSTLVQALQDHSPDVRGLALELLGEAEGPLPIDQIAQIVTADPNPEQRMEAIVVLASRNEEAAHTILTTALDDADPEVVELAKILLQDLEVDSEWGEFEESFSAGQAPTFP